MALTSVNTKKTSSSSTNICDNNAEIKRHTQFLNNENSIQKLNNELTYDIVFYVIYRTNKMPLASN